MRRFVTAALLPTIFLACQPGTIELTDQQRGEIAAEVELAASSFFDAWRDGDFDRGIGFWVQSPDIAYTNQGVVNFGYDHMVNLFRPGFERVASQEFRISDQRTVVLAPDVVAVIAQYINTVTNTDGVTSPEREFVGYTIWTRQNGEWKVMLVHESARPIAPPDTP